MKLPKQVVASLLARFATSSLPLREILMMARIIFQHQADCFYESALEDGRPLIHTDPMGTKQWLEELAEAAKVDAWPGAEGTSTLVPFGLTQRRRSDKPCSVCGHMHEGDGECGKWIGQGRFCKCSLEVSA